MCSSISSCCHVIAPNWLIGREKDVGGLSRTKHDDPGREWLIVGCVISNYCQHVIGDSEEEFLIECSIDDSQKNCFSEFDVELFCFYIRPDNTFIR